MGLLSTLIVPEVREVAELIENNFHSARSVKSINEIGGFFVSKLCHHIDYLGQFLFKYYSLIKIQLT